MSHKHNKNKHGGFTHAQLESFTHKALKELTPYEIVEKAIPEMPLVQDPNKVYAALLKMVSMPKFRILRSKNSLLLIENLQQGKANGTFFFADPMELRDDVFMDCAKALKVGKFNQVSFLEKTNHISEFAQKANLKSSTQHTGDGFNTTVIL
jgi:hypothetical protein